MTISRRSMLTNGLRGAALLAVAGSPRMRGLRAQVPSPAPAAIGDETFPVIVRLAQGGPGAFFQNPVDAAPVPDQWAVFFLAEGYRGPGVFRVSTLTGAVTEVSAGAPFRAPSNLMISADSQTVYIADPSTEADATAKGAIFRMGIQGGVPAAIPATAGTRPQGIDVMGERGDDTLYFTGFDPVSKQPSIWRWRTGAARAELLYSGWPLNNPGGIAVRDDGTLYVADKGPGPTGAVYELPPGATMMQPVVLGAGLGEPSGVALNKEGTMLLISAIDRDTNTDRLITVNLWIRHPSIVRKAVSANQMGGGIHRTHMLNAWAWSDRIGGVHILECCKSSGR